MSIKKTLLIYITVLGSFLIANNSIAQDSLKFDCSCSNGMNRTLVISKSDTKATFIKYEITSPIDWRNIFFLKMEQNRLVLAEDNYGTNSIDILSPTIKDSTFRMFKFGNVFGGGVTTLDNSRAKFSSVTSHSSYFSEILYSEGTIINLNYYDGRLLHKCLKTE